MRSFVPSLNDKLPQKSTVLQALLIVAVLTAMIGLYVGINSQSGSSESSIVSTRKTALDSAQDHIADNFPQLASVELTNETLREEDGVWMFVFRCEEEQVTDSANGGKRVTLRLFVDEESLDVWGSTTDGW